MGDPPQHRLDDTRRPVHTTGSHQAPNVAPCRIEADSLLRRLPTRAWFSRHRSCGSQTHRRRAVSRQLSPPSYSECDLGSYHTQRGSLPSRSFHDGITSCGCRPSISFFIGFGNPASAHVAVCTDKVFGPDPSWVQHQFVRPLFRGLRCRRQKKIIVHSNACRSLRAQSR